jgi:glycosyltransferase involved in cell wall biosynthesis
VSQTSTKVWLMKIVIVSRGDASSGGAGRIAELLATGLSNRGLEIAHFVQRTPRSAYRKKCKRLLSLRGDVLLRNAMGFDIGGLHLLLQREVWSADIIHFHDFSLAYGSIITLFLAKRKPIVLSLHDFSGFTGGCLYPMECLRYMAGCGKCPQVGASPLPLPIDLTRYYFRQHQKIAACNWTIAVSPSHYLASEARKGAWKKGRICVIPNGVDSDLFNPAQRNAGRALLKLEESDRAILFVAGRVNDPRKGFPDLAKSFLHLADQFPELVLVLVGEMNEIPSELTPYLDRIRRLGTVNDSQIMAKVYAGCDCHVLPTRADNFPCTILESLSAGTPVLAYPTGGIPEILGATNYGSIVESKSWQGLADGIIRILRGSSQYNNIRKFATERYSLAHFIRWHISLYDQVLSLTDN